MMFAPFCPTHDSTVLMTRRNVLDFWNGPNGAVIRWKCSCGHEGLLDPSGSTPDTQTPDIQTSIQAEAPANTLVEIQAQPVACSA